MFNSCLISDDYEHISLEERELLLSEIYSLLNPGKVFVSEEDLTKIMSPEDRMKYIAAVELAQTKSTSLPRSTSVFAFPSHHAPPTSSSSSSHQSPLTKPRHKSESAAEINHGRVMKVQSRLSDTKKRKTLPKVRIWHKKSLSISNKLKKKYVLSVFNRVVTNT